MKKNASPKKKATSVPKTKKPSAATKKSELLAVTLPIELTTGMDFVGIRDRDQYISFLIAASLLNYSKIWKEAPDLEKKLENIKADCDHQNHLR